MRKHRSRRYFKSHSPLSPRPQAVFCFLPWFYFMCMLSILDFYIVFLLQVFHLKPNSRYDEMKCEKIPATHGFSEVHLTWLSAGKTRNRTCVFSLKHSRTCEYANSFQITSLAAWHKMSSRKISAYVQWRLEVFNITAGWILDQDCLPNYLWSHKWCL